MKVSGTTAPTQPLCTAIGSSEDLEGYVRRLKAEGGLVVLTCVDSVFMEVERLSA